MPSAFKVGAANRLIAGPKRKILLAAWLILVGLLATVLTVAVSRWAKRRTVTLMGTVLRQDGDTRKQSPISDVEITVGDNLAIGRSKSGSAGYFSIPLRPDVKPGQPVALRLRHPDYKPLDLTEVAGDKIIVVRMAPLQTDNARLQISIGNVLVRYSIKTQTVANVGSASKTFQVVNTGNVPCKGQTPCSPEGKWKAAIASTSLDAGDGNEFQNARVTCIAGPCTFTQIVSDSFSRGGRNISVAVRNWSDTTTFLIEAEVIHPTLSDITRDSYPVIFDRTLSFTLPPAAEGPSIEADVNGETMVFPLGPGPNLCLSWANCSIGTEKDQAKAYRCELTPGYRFR